MQFKSLNRTISEQTKEFEIILLWEKFFVCSESETLSTATIAKILVIIDILIV